MTIEEETNMFQQQRDLLNAYKAQYGGWYKIPIDKYSATFKLLHVSKDLGIDGILRKLKIDPCPIADDDDDEMNDENGDEPGKKLFFLFFFCQKK